MRYTVVIVDVREPFVAWLRAQGYTRAYFPEEDAVWVVPNHLVGGKSPETFLDDHAEALLGAEMERFQFGDRTQELLRTLAIGELIRVRFRDHIAEGAEIGLQ
ncbi:MAG: hypothetical protein JKY37_22245 [Nannocystaceae bacterium]|nr:hypothetical protein [Nannocystaceae bacterium]